MRAGPALTLNCSEFIWCAAGRYRPASVQTWLKCRKPFQIKYLHQQSLDPASPATYPAQMRVIPRLTLLLAMALTQAAYAAPQQAGSPDDLDQLLAERGLIGQISQVGQSVGGKASELVISAMGFLGVPYKRGGTSLETGFDCSGFVRAMYQQTIGLILPRTADQQAAATVTIEKSELQPGDLVFFNTLRRAFSHVGIYVGDDKFIHSPRPGAEVRVEDMRLGYWRSRFNGARRVETTARP
jgi:cell wall-associated NlpC family hydrolase